MPRTVRVSSPDGEWIAELGTAGVTLSGVTAAFVVIDEGGGRFVVTHDGARTHGIAAAGGDAVWVGTDGHVFEFRVSEDGGAARPVARDQDALSPPMSATVVRVAVRPGATVQAGDTLVVLEAMKMELPIRAPRAARVLAVHCQEGALVQPGTVLIDLE